MKIRYEWVNHLLSFISVILGVYLAFYLNEKAAVNKEIKEGQLLMNSLIIDLSEDIEVYEDYQIPENTQQYRNIDTLIELLLKDSLVDIEEKFILVFQVENYTPTTSTYNSMKSSGNLNLIDDLVLQKELTDFYEGAVSESIRKGEFQADYFTSELLGWLTNNVDLRDMKLLDEANLIALPNKLIVYQSLIDQKINSYRLIVEESKKLKLSIESKINPK